MSSHNPPEFKSSIPNHLLADISDKDRFIIEQLSIMGQKSDWLVHETQEQSKELVIIKTETKTTNGKIAKAILDINDLQNKEKAKLDDWTEVKEIVSIKLFVQKYLFNRYALIGLGIFTIGFLKIMADDELRGFFFKLLGLG